MAGANLDPDSISYILTFFVGSLKEYDIMIEVLRGLSYNIQSGIRRLFQEQKLKPVGAVSLGGYRRLYVQHIMGKWTRAEALLEAGKTGDLGILDVLYHAGVRKESVEEDRYRAIKFAALNGHTKILERFQKVWKVNKQDLIHCGCILQYTVQGKHPDTLTSLHTLFQFGAQEARGEHNHALRLALRGNELQILKVLRNTFNLTLTDVEHIYQTSPFLFQHLTTPMQIFLSDPTEGFGFNKIS